MPRDKEDLWQDAWMRAVESLAVTLTELNRANPWPELPLLDQAMPYLMTELWDRGFNTHEIASGFERAQSNLPMYAAGER